MPSMTTSMDTSDLDLLVKGSLPSGSPPAQPEPPAQPKDPLEAAPSSPSQIYLNLLILEASLRSQYLNHLARRRKFTFFLILLFLWIAFFYYRFFILGGSPYYYFSLFEKLGLGGGVGTGVLYYATGLYHKTIVEPRRFVAIANRGIRGFNVKLVKQPLSYKEWINWWWDWYTFRAPPAPPVAPTPASRRLSANTRRPVIPPVMGHRHSGSFSSAQAQRPVVKPGPNTDDDDDDDEVEEYLPGGLHIKLVIMPKGFSPDFREGWEVYRTEYWDKENEARALRREEIKRNRHKITPTKSATAEVKVRHSSISLRNRTPTPDPESKPVTGRPRRGSTASLKRRSLPGMSGVAGVSRASTPGDISDSGSTTSALGEGKNRTPRKTGKGRGKKRAPRNDESAVDD
ncbi:Spo7-like protein-domain-containing protein [Pyronema omphalodes]|nr:Spo7-like protein-domain-containing protein [Pyronema omphalodes]